MDLSYICDMIIFNFILHTQMHIYTMILILPLCLCYIITWYATRIYYLFGFNTVRWEMIYAITVCQL